MDNFLIDGKSVRDELLSRVDLTYRKFSEGLNPSVENILGVRIPDLRWLARRIAKGEWTTYLDTANNYYMEERLLQGLVLGYVKPGDKVEAYLERVSAFVHIINSWSVCDSFSFAGGKIFVKANEAIIWPFLKKCMNSKEEYEVRFGVVMSMKYFIDKAHIEELFGCLDSIHHDGYYAKMAVAWALSDCFVWYPQPTLDFLQKNSLDDLTYKYTLRKIRESDRVSDEMKHLLV